jgi:hypothetical protein
MVNLIPEQLLAATIELACFYCAVFTTIVTFLFAPRG